MTPTRPIMRWHGGKWELSAWILDQMPSEHSVYVEPFGGVASILLQKRRLSAEVYNDLDEAAVTVFRVLQDKAKAELLRHRLSLTPYARAEFDRSYEEPTDDVDLAAKMIVRSFFGYGANAVTRRTTTGFNSRATDNRFLPSASWPGWVMQIPLFTDRLMGVTIEQKPALDIIKQHDSPVTLFYCDPPYVLSERSNTKHGRWTGRGYRHEMDDQQHRELAAKLHDVDGMVMLSGYPSKLYAELYGDWNMVQCKALAEGAKPRVECLWFNPAAWARRRCQPLLMEAHQ